MALSDYVGSVEVVFKRDDIRGVYGRGIDVGFARALGKALAEVLRRTTAVEPVNVAVGHDMRLSGAALAAALCGGLVEGGCRPIELGLAGTELVGFVVAHYREVIDGGVIVTASHNPPDNNGFKFFGRGGQPLPLASTLPPPRPEDELKRCALAVEKMSIPPRLRWEQFAPDYIRTALDRGRLKFESGTAADAGPMRIAVEAGNGMGGRIMREFAALAPQFEWTFSNDRPDGRFPTVIPNPLMREYQELLGKLVRESRSHVGMCFDGDADRIALADERGEMLSPPLLAAMVGMRLRQKLGPEAKIAHNLACSWVIPDTLGERANVTGDGPTLMTPVGYGKIKTIMHHRPDIAFAAEHSGHYMFREFYNADSGMLAGLMFLEHAAELHAQGKTLSAELAPMRQRYCESGEINFEMPPGRSARDAIVRAAAEFRDQAVRMFAVGKEGVRPIDQYPPPFEVSAPDVRVEGEHWWFVMRTSGTEAAEVCRLYVESDGDRKLMEQRRDRLIELIGVRG